MAPRPAPLRTVVLGDLHGSLTAFRTILGRSGLVDGDSWRGGRSILVQLGDVIDRGPDSIETYEFLAQLQIRSRKGKGKVVRLLGNHELSLLEGQYDLTNFPDPGALAERIRTDILGGRVQAAYAHNGWLFTHAGLHMNLLQSVQAEMKAEKTQRFTLRRLVEHLNRKMKDSVEAGEFKHSIFAVGRARGGECDTGGIFWADFDRELKAPSRAPRFHQVFGHTPEGYEGARFRQTSDGRRINIDIGIADAYGGNLGYLEILGREAIAHYIVGDHEEIVSLGRAPQAHVRKEPREAPPAEPQRKAS